MKPDVSNTVGITSAVGSIIQLLTAIDRFREVNNLM
jgi:hypothetical protein